MPRSNVISCMRTYGGKDILGCFFVDKKVYIYHNFDNKIYNYPNNFIC